MNDKRRQHYLAYMLRLWKTNTGKGPAWRASLESPHTGERQGFVDLETLFAFLKEKTDNKSQSDTMGGEKE
ncbi:MAG: hypothetical protein GY832_14405 [Chloroflexi bacterium]|nr:hypothetical protein [Chloroflexota bacterium]